MPHFMTLTASIFMAALAARGSDEATPRETAHRQAISEITELDCSFGEIADDLLSAAHHMEGLIARWPIGSGLKASEVARIRTLYLSALNTAELVDPVRTATRIERDGAMATMGTRQEDVEEEKSGRLMAVGLQIAKNIQSYANLLDGVLDKWSTATAGGQETSSENDEIEGIRVQVRMTAAAAWATNDMRKIMVAQSEKRGVTFERAFYGTRINCGN